ncbi:MAG: hypothetical protein EA426_12935 [Spirochaetaceae bacterium]|nr:MAG: hypothetical protein EA426_12935 [Spirochaetaceae bacterium]
MVSRPVVLAFFRAVFSVIVAIGAFAQTAHEPDIPTTHRAIDPSLISTRFTTGVDFPLQSRVRPLFAPLAYGTSLMGWLPLPFLPFLAPTVGINYTLVPIRAESSFSSVAVGLGATAIGEFGRFSATGSVVGGGYLSFLNQTARDPDGFAYDEQSGAAGYVAAGVDATYLLNPVISFGIGALYHSMFGLYEGVRAHVNVTLDVSGFRRKTRLRGYDWVPIFPALIGYYPRASLAKAVVTNDEKFPITNVRVEFLVPEYMSAPWVSEPTARLEPGESLEFDVNAIFSERVLGLTDGVSAPSELTVRYELNGRERSASQPQSILIHNRNAMTWEDDRRAAAFVTPRDPEIIRFASSVVGTVRREGPASVNPNLRVGIGVFNAISNTGMSYVVDPSTPSYVDASENPFIVDFLQFPRQTFDFRGGDCDDLSILYAALLESVGVPTAFVTIPGHIFLAFSLEIRTAEAQRMFPDHGLFIDVDGDAWIPVETTLVGRGFHEAWRVGAEQWYRHADDGTAELFPMASNWELFPPPGYPVEGTRDSEIRVSSPNENALVRVYRDEVAELVRRQLYPQVAQIRSRLATSRDPARDLNRLGVLYARFGLDADAETAFEEALAIREYAPALVNLANIHYLRGEFEVALAFFERASRAIPNEPAVLLSLSRVYYELERYAEARTYLERLKRTDPDLGAEYGYLAVVDETGTRASGVALRHDKILWLEDDEEDHR